jgi:hypothetical protein
LGQGTKNIILKPIMTHSLVNNFSRKGRARQGFFGKRICPWRAGQMTQRNNVARQQNAIFMPVRAKRLTQVQPAIDNASLFAARAGG